MSSEMGLLQSHSAIRLNDLLYPPLSACQVSKGGRGRHPSLRKGGNARELSPPLMFWYMTTRSNKLYYWPFSRCQLESYLSIPPHLVLRCVNLWVRNCVKTRRGSKEAGFTQFLTHKSTLLSTSSCHGERQVGESC